MVGARCINAMKDLCYETKVMKNALSCAGSGGSPNAMT